MFPVQIITTVDSRVVQLDYLDGRLLISSLTRTYLCDTERQVLFYFCNTSEPHTVSEIASMLLQLAHAPWSVSEDVGRRSVKSFTEIKINISR